MTTTPHAPEYLVIRPTETSDQDSGTTVDDWIDPMYAWLLAASLAPVLGPVGRFVAPGLAAIYTWLSEPSTKSSQKAAAEFLEQQEKAKNLAKISLADARQSFQFEPGNPVIGQVYQRHPLGALDDRFEKTYLPLESFDRLLIDERRCEILRILVDLGASQVRQSEVISVDREFGASVGVGHSASGTEASAEYSRQASEQVSRGISFELPGRGAESIKTFSEDAYRWLPFEPEWRALVHARRFGACTRGSVHVTVGGSYGGGMSLKFSSIAASVDGETRSQASDLMAYRLDVEFLPVEDPTSPS